MDSKELHSDRDMELKGDQAQSGMVDVWMVIAIVEVSS